MRRFQAEMTVLHAEVTFEYDRNQKDGQPNRLFSFSLRHKLWFVIVLQCYLTIALYGIRNSDIAIPNRR